MDYDKEITALAGETLALQALLTHLLAELSIRDDLGPSVRRSFEQATAELARVEKEHPDAQAQITKARSVLDELHIGVRGRRAHAS